MDKELLKKYNIDPALPPEQILALLQSKNLELLERMGSCSDDARLAQLQGEQQEVEQACLYLAGAVSLDRQVAQTDQHQQSGQAADSSLAAALQDYRSGNLDSALPVLEEHARQGDPLCCNLVANILLSQKRAKEAKEYLYLAANAGDGTAALQLARQYEHEGKLSPAIKWAQEALKQKEAGSGRLLASLFQKNNTPDLAVDAYLSELDRATKYDLYLLTHDIVSLLSAGILSPAAAKRLRTQTAEKIKNDSRSMDYWLEHTKEPDQAPVRIAGTSFSVPSYVPALLPTLALALLATSLSFALMYFIGSQTDFAEDAAWPAGAVPAVLIILVALFRVISRRGANSVRILVTAAAKAVLAFVVFTAAFSYAFESDSRAIALVVALAAHFCGSALLLR